MNHPLGPVGMVPYLPTHNHRSNMPCIAGCPVKDWNEHVAMYGNPYDKMATDIINQENK